MEAGGLTCNVKMNLKMSSEKVRQALKTEARNDMSTWTAVQKMLTVHDPSQVGKGRVAKLYARIYTKLEIT